MSKQYLRKNEFKYSTSPAVRRKDGKGHVVYITVEHDDRVKANVITHSKSFFREKTYAFKRNPQIGSKDKRPSRYSVPRWIERGSLRSPFGIWHMDNQDKRNIHKTNRAYERRRKKR